MNMAFVPVPASASTASTGPASGAGRSKEKPTKRSCSVTGCHNGVVQGGVCVAHGAKRRLCQFPGCTISAKCAGKCSKHGYVPSTWLISRDILLESDFSTFIFV